MSEWREKKLGDVALFIDYRGKTPRKTSAGIPLITAKIVKNGAILPPNEFIASEDYDAWMTRGLPQIGDVVLTTEAPLGEVAQLKEAHVALAQRIITLRANADVLDNTFLKYFLQSAEGQRRLKMRESGTTVTGIKSSELQEVLIPLPNLETQRRIARILSSLDDKIEVNNQINRNLEEQAQILLEQISQNKQIIKLGDILSFVNGFAFKSGTYISNGIYKIITIKNVQDGKIDSDGAETISVIPQKMKQDCILHDGDVLLSLTGNVGRVGIVCEDNLLLNQRVAKIVAHDPNLNAAAYFIMRRNATKTLLVSISRGTAQANLSPVESLNVGVPFNIESIQRLAPVINCLFRQIVKNEKENQRLSAIRDTLLPKLMSGEIDF